MSLSDEVWIASSSDHAALSIAGRLALAGCAVRVGSPDACESIGRGVPAAVVFAQTDPTTLGRVRGVRARHPHAPIVVVSDAADIRQLLALMRLRTVDVVLEEDGPESVWETVSRMTTAALEVDEAPRAPASPGFSVHRPPALPTVPAASSILAITRGGYPTPAFITPSPTPRAPASAVGSRSVPAAPDLPILDPRVEKLDELMRRDDCSTQDVERFAAQDLVLVQAIIKASNTAYYRSPKMVTNLRDAIVRVGNKQVFALMVETLVRKAFDVPSPEAKALLSGLWNNAPSRPSSPDGSRSGRVLRAPKTPTSPRSSTISGRV